ncbi:MAG: pilus assembly protein TadE [Rhodobacteraceae bacterium]|nr:MAG: pilus assembly protein TadE [Paracoccaceae bacterium]
MVRRGSRQCFAADERGLSLTEALLVMPIVLLVLVAMIEFGTAVFQWNQATKAVQIGARLAAVSSPVTGDTAYLALTADHAGIPEGDPTPAGLVSVSCGAGTTACDSARLARLLDGGDGSCQPSGGLSMMGMCDVAPFIGPENVRVTYYRSGLGYVGRPFGPVSTITVELRNLTFDFLIADELIPGLSSLTIPAQPVSITSEDVNDCRDTCP